MKIMLPKYYGKFLLKMGILMLIFTLCRLLFYWRNVHFFPEAGFYEFLVGFWFDLITTCLLFYPLIVIELFPNRNRNRGWFRWTIISLSLISYAAGIFINLTDIEYFAFTSARSNASLFTMLSFGTDLSQQIPSFLHDFWYWLLLFVALIVGTFFFFRKLYRQPDDSSSVAIWKQLVLYVITIGMGVFIGRGGFVYKPIRANEASKYTETSNTQLVLNSAFTVLNSLGMTSLEEKVYFEEAELVRYYSTIQQLDDRAEIHDQNIVILILESFSLEYIGSLNENGTGCTPFFDELVDSSLVFTRAFANGKKSIDALPAITASIPKMMNDEFLLTPYSVNKFRALPEFLEDIGYQTAFFHGATNGSMNFDAFTASAGFSEYYGRTEYNNDADYDGTWGIFDDKFMSWSVDQFSQMKAPFFTTLFTISSHPPYAIPAEFEDQFSDASSEMARSIEYTDLALRKFFEKAAQQDWYKNTLFVLTADHTPNSSQASYVNEIGKMHIPLLFFHPTDSLFRGERNNICGQIDIMPSILDLLGFQQSFFSFGHSIFESSAGYTFSEIAGKQLLFESYNGDDFLLISEAETPKALYRLEDFQQKENLISTYPDVVRHLEYRLKAIVQTYNHAFIHNEMTLSNAR